MALCYTAAARQVFSLNDEWLFFYKTETSSDNARRISLPHTWNLDALSGRSEYLKTTANYSRTLFIPKEWEQKRMFIKFYGVQSVADVFVNGHHVGEHRGGWTAFTFEITKHLRFGEDNLVVVVVNNAYQNDVLPTSSELNLYGGIYRDVELIVTEQTTISPLYYGCDGVLIHQNNVTDTVVDATAAVWVTSISDKLCDLYISVRGPYGDVVYSRYLKEQNPAVRVVAVEPADSPLLSEGRAGPHGLQGIGANFVPRTLDTGIYDEIIPVRTEEAYAAARRLAREQGFLCGISGGAAA